MHSGRRMPNLLAISDCPLESATPVLRMTDSCLLAHTQTTGRIALTTTDMTTSYLKPQFLELFQCLRITSRIIHRIMEHSGSKMVPLIRQVTPLAELRVE